MFEIKKIISAFLLPGGFLFLLSIFSLVLSIFKKNKYNFCLSAFFAFFIYLFSSNFLWKYLICRIEEKIYERSSDEGDVIAVFGGGVSFFLDKISASYSVDSISAQRIFAAYRVYQKKHIDVIVSGGYVLNQRSFGYESSLLLQSIGVDAERIHQDTSSKDTLENVEMISKICKKKGFKKIIAVSDAIHLPRIAYLLDKKGIKFSLYPSSYMCSNFSYLDFLPGDFRYSSVFIHEFYGNIWYFVINWLKTPNRTQH